MHPIDVIIVVFFAAWICSWFNSYYFSLNSVMFRTSILAGLWFSPIITSALDIPRWLFWLLNIVFLYGIIRDLRYPGTVWELFTGVKEGELSDENRD